MKENHAEHPRPKQEGSSLLISLRSVLHSEPPKEHRAREAIKAMPNPSGRPSSKDPAHPRAFAAPTPGNM